MDTNDHQPPDDPVEPDAGSPWAHPGYGVSPGDPGYGVSPGDPGYGVSPGDPGYGVSPGDPGYGVSPGDPGYGVSPGDPGEPAWEASVAPEVLPPEAGSGWNPPSREATAAGEVSGSWRDTAAAPAPEPARWAPPDTPPPDMRQGLPAGPDFTAASSWAVPPGTTTAPGPGMAARGVAPSGERRFRRLAGFAAIAVLAGATGSVLTLALDDDSTIAFRGDPTPLREASVLDGDRLDVAEVIAAVEPAVVAIETQLSSGRMSGSAAGTGVILTEDGDVLTNAHVVDGADRIRVVLVGESRAREAEVIGLDTTADLALLHIPGASGLPTAVLGDSSAVAVGDDVVAIGNALALRGGPSVTRGIISALDRTLETEEGVMTGLIQTDASISSGNSGGPLVNASGQVVGINTAVATGGRGSAAENIGFAIAISRALPVVERLRGGEVSAIAFLGVRSQDPTDGTRAADIVIVEPGSPAEAAGLKPGDLITHVADKSVAGAAELGGAVAEHRPGDEVELRILRDGEPSTLKATLGTKATTD